MDFILIGVFQLSCSTYQLVDCTQLLSKYHLTVNTGNLDFWGREGGATARFGGIQVKKTKPRAPRRTPPGLSGEGRQPSPRSGSLALPRPLSTQQRAGLGAEAGRERRRAEMGGSRTRAATQPRQRERGAPPHRPRPRCVGERPAAPSIPDTGPAPPLGCSALPPAAASGSPSPPLPRCPLAAWTPWASWGGEPEPELPPLALAGPLTLLRPASIYRFCPRRPPALRSQDPRTRCALRVPQFPAQHVGTRGPTVALGAEGAVRPASAPPWPRLVTGQVPCWKLHLPIPILGSPKLRAAHARAFSRLGARGLALADPGRLFAGRAPGARARLRARRGPRGWACPSARAARIGAAPVFGSQSHAFPPT